MNSKVEKQEFDKYLAEAQSWETSKVKALDKSRKVGWIFGGVAAGVAVMSSTAAVVMAFAWMNPPSPPVIRVDETTGAVDMVTTVKDGKTTYEEAVNKFFTQWYVRYREGYSRDLAEDYYNNVGLMSAPTEQQRYHVYFNPKNPQSPLNVYGPYAKVKVDIKGTSFIQPNIALVRYTKSIERGADKPVVSHWAATITFRYTGAPMKEKDREINPLGFQAVEYRNDSEAIAVDAGTGNSAAPNPATGTMPAAVLVYPGQEPVVPAISQ